MFSSLDVFAMRLCSLLVSWYFQPSPPLGITSGLEAKQHAQHCILSHCGIKSHCLHLRYIALLHGIALAVHCTVALHCCIALYGSAALQLRNCITSSCIPIRVSIEFGLVSYTDDRYSFVVMGQSQEVMDCQAILYCTDLWWYCCITSVAYALQTALFQDINIYCIMHCCIALLFSL